MTVEESSQLRFGQRADLGCNDLAMIEQHQGWDAANAIADTLISEYDIRTPSKETGVGTLSGGNQQKVIVARELSRDLRLTIAAQPTRGVDVGSIEYIHSRIVKERDAGTAVLIVSTELDEVMALSDRLLVMFLVKESNKLY
jgi:simple sugar transport system ATP-binding protein